MVSLVLVSHSRPLAEALVPLIREMATDEVAIAIAAGTGENRDAFGTDATDIMQAIASVDTGDGVLVLGDMGSALLSTDMALELLPDDLRSRTRLISAPFVEGALAAAIQASMGNAVDDVAREARQALAQKQQHVGDSDDAPDTEEGSAPDASPAVSEGAATGDSYDDAPEHTTEVELTNLHGLHARPAAQLVRTASQFSAVVTVKRLEDNRAPVSATSISSVSTLGARRGNRLQITARGPDAEEALQALSNLITHGFDDDTPATESGGATPQHEAPADRSTLPDDGAVAGLPVHAGTAVAPAARLHTALPDLPTTQNGSPEAEWAALQNALKLVQRDLRMQARRGARNVQGILEAQALLLEDDALLSAARTRITESDEPAPLAWARATEALAEEYASLGDAYMQARANDVRDVGRRVVLELLDDAADVVSLPDRPLILVADDLPPSVVPHLDPEQVRGVVCTGGNPTGHNAILLRGRGIPSVFGVGAALQHVDNNTLLGLDGGTGHVWVDPPPKRVEQLESKRRQADERTAVYLAEAHDPATTTDGTVVTVSANISHPSEAETAAERGAEGVGLLRTEFLFGDTPEPPSEEEQLEALKTVAAPFKKAPVTVRALDAGGDKPLPYLSFPDEANPFLGMRGIRVLLRHPELFRTQLRAVLRASASHNVRLMLPMVATLSEIRKTRSLLQSVRAALNHVGTLYAANIPVGIMVETPASAVAVAQLASHVDFFSIGTNDLVQYVMAADREHADLAALSDALHPPVLQLIRQVVEAAGDRPVSICGEAAADPEAIPVLVGLGIRNLSVNAEALPATKALIRALSLSDLTALAKRALVQDGAPEVRALAREALPAAFAPDEQ